MYIENKFLNVVTAPETFHRIGFSNEVLPADEYKSRRRSIVRAVPKEHRDWLGNRLQFANEPRLSDRLRDLAQLAGEGFRWLVPDEEQFIDVVVHVRNRLTHFDEDADRVTESEPLWLYSEALYVLVAVAALSTAQVSEDALARLYERNSACFGCAVNWAMCSLSRTRERQPGDAATMRRPTRRSTSGMGLHDVVAARRHSTRRLRPHIVSDII